MSKLKILSGLPGSGKTTLAREMVKDGGNSARINRADLRAMLFDSVWTGKREHVVVEIERAVARICLREGLTPIVDDTNLTPKHVSMWNATAKSCDAELEIKVMPATLAECVARDSQREKPVGEAVISRMALFAEMIEFDPGLPIVLVDIDGTIANGEHREIHLAGDRKDWRAYYSLLHLDKPIQHIIDRVNKLAEDHMILIVSGRPDTYQHETLKWLRETAQIQFDYFFQRAGSDRREDSIIKKEILDKLPKEQIVKVFDDRPRVCRMWEAEGLDVEWCRGRDCPEF